VPLPTLACGEGEGVLLGVVGLPVTDGVVAAGVVVAAVVGGLGALSFQ
jgi:hypothetical protein